MELVSKLAALLPNWQVPPGNTSQTTIKHHECLKDIIEVLVFLKNEGARKDETIKMLENRCTALEAQVQQLANKTQTGPSGGFSYSEAVMGKKHVVNESEVVLLATVAREAKQRESIERNIIISGLPESAEADETKRNHDERKVVEELLAVLKVEKEKIKRVKRIRNNGNVERTANAALAKPNIVLVELDSSATQSIAISNTRKLRNDDRFKHVFVNKDRTHSERVFEKKLREKRNALNNELEHTEEVHGRQRKFGTENGRRYFWDIRNGAVVRVFVKQN